MIGAWLEALRGDDVVDQLIAANRATPRPGMDKPDHDIIAKSGRATWARTVRAQERYEHGDEEATDG